jgi:hypothetical protein
MDTFACVYSEVALAIREDVLRNLRNDLRKAGLPLLMAEAAIDDLSALAVFDTPSLWREWGETASKLCNDAVIYGILDPALLAREIEIGISPFGSQTRSGRWKNWKTTVGGLLSKLTKHAVGEKDGACFLQGAVIDGERRSSSIPHLDLLVLDLDTGENIDEARQKLIDLGLFSVIYTTHSHLKPITEVKKDAVVKWIGEDRDPDLGDVSTYLTEVKRYRPAILEGAELLETQHTAEGVKLRIRHLPMPKFRIVLLLQSRFVVMDRAATQQAAITEWKERYAGASKALGAFFDRSCVDPSRLFYLPRHPKGVTGWRIEVISGKPLDLDSVDRVTQEEVRRGAMSAFEQAAADMGRGSGRSYKTDNLLYFFAKHGDRFDIESFLLEMDPDGDRGPRSAGLGRTHRCPNDDAHSNAGDENDKGFFCVNAGDSEAGHAVARCMHDACANLDRINFTDMICERVGIADATDLKQWVPETVEEHEEADASASPSGPTQRSSKKREADEFHEDNEKLFAGFGREWAYVAEGAGGRFVKVLRDGNLEFRTVDALAKLYAHKPVIYRDDNGKVKMRQLVPEWLRWTGSEERKFAGLQFAPGKQDGAITPYLNTWRGLGVTPKQGSWSRMRTHIREVLTSGNEQDDRFVMGWMAHVLQHIGDVRNKLTVSPVIRGEEGTGKSIVFDYYRRIFGRHGVVLSKPEQIVGRFNASLSEALVVQLEEAFFAGDPRIDGPLKDLLTGRDVTIERKNVDPIAAPNFAHFVIISNDERPVPIKEGSRRYYPIECSSAKINDSSWFDPIVKEMENGGIEAMAYDLLHWGPSDGDWGFLRQMPRTGAGNRMIAAGLEPLERFLLEWVHTGGVGYGASAVSLSHAEETLITAHDLVLHFEEWAEKNVQQRRERETLKTDAAAIGLKLKHMFPKVPSIHTRDGNRRKFPTQPRTVEMLRQHRNGGYGAYLDRLRESES